MAKKTTFRVVRAKPGNSKKQVFKIKAHGAGSVELVGDFTDWQRNPISLRLGDDGLWQAKVALAPGAHHYRFLVDGEWRDDPDCSVRVPNHFGSQDCVCHVG